MNNHRSIFKTKIILLFAFSICLSSVINAMALPTNMLDSQTSINLKNERMATLTNVTMHCTTTENLNGLHIAPTQNIEFVNTRGATVSINFTVQNASLGGLVTVNMTMNGTLTGLDVITYQELDFINTTTGVVSGVDFVIEDIVDH